MPDWGIDKIFLFIILIFPGFITVKVYSLIIATDKKDFSKLPIDIICYSLLNLAACSWLIITINTGQFYQINPIRYWLSICFIMIIMPALWPCFYLVISKTKIFKKYMLSPINQPWDHFFNKKEACWVTIHLKKGKVVRGRYSLGSKASAYPKERQIYLAELWKSKENGGFEKVVKGTKGGIFFESEISYIEFNKQSP